MDDLTYLRHVAANPQPRAYATLSSKPTLSAAIAALPTCQRGQLAEAAIRARHDACAPLHKLPDLFTHNGRDPVVDELQEANDGFRYAVQAWLEGKAGAWERVLRWRDMVLDLVDAVLADGRG